jgi:hypothetical protein
MPRSLVFTMQHNICRFCKKYENEGRFKLVKYGVRHYAHADCGLEARGVGFLDSLTDWQCTQFPYRAAADAGTDILAELILRCDRYNAIEKSRTA